MTRPRTTSLACLTTIALAAALIVPGTSHAAGPASVSPGAPESKAKASPVEGPARPEPPPSDAPAVEAPAAEAPPPTDEPDASDPAPTDGPAATEPVPSGAEPPPPRFEPPSESGIEFAVPPPGDPAPPSPEEIEAERPLALTFPDPGSAPSDGASMLVLSGATIGLTAVAFSSGLAIGLRNQVPLEWLLPSTIVPTVGVLAFAGGGLYLGIKRARAYRRWEIGNRVIGTPQGGGLTVGGSFALLGALGFIPSGAFALNNGDSTAGATMLGIGGAAAVATPIMFILGSRRQREYQRTGGWKRRPIPELPPGAQTEDETAKLQWVPLVTPIPGGVSVGAAGRF